MFPAVSLLPGHTPLLGRGNHMCRLHIIFVSNECFTSFPFTLYFILNNMWQTQLDYNRLTVKGEVWSFLQNQFLDFKKYNSFVEIQLICPTLGPD